MKLVRILDGTRRTGLALAGASLLVASVAPAASEGEHREHEPHEHGHGTLDIALEGQELVAELRAPAVNVVGFEHRPRDDAEREAVRKALAPFSVAAAVLAPSTEAECEAERIEAEIAGMDHEEHHEGEEHRESVAGHEDERRGDDADMHAKHEREEREAHDEHEDHAADSGAGMHSELVATYHFHCHAPGRLTRIDVRAFELLHDAEEIEVRVVTATAQTAMEIHPGETVVELSP